MFYSQIVGTGKAFPKKIMTNQDFEKFLDTTDEWIESRTGIKERHIIDPKQNESTMTLSYAAGAKALEMAKLNPKDLELIVTATVTPDTVMPTNGNQLQALFGASKAFSFDMQAACAGWLYALSIADHFIKAGTVNNALVVGSETLSTLTNWQDRSTCILFGDGAGAVVLKKSEDPNHRIIDIALYSDGTLGGLLIIPHGYGKVPPDSPEYIPSEHKIKMKGKEIFKLATTHMVQSSLDMLSKHNLKISDIDFFIFHQANMRIIDFCCNALGIPKEKTWINIEKYANTSAATLPVCLDEAWKSGKVSPGKKILMATFGGGVTWAAGLIQL